MTGQRIQSDSTPYVKAQYKLPTNKQQSNAGTQETGKDTVQISNAPAATQTAASTGWLNRVASATAKAPKMWEQGASDIIQWFANLISGPTPTKKIAPQDLTATEQEALKELLKNTYRNTKNFPLTSDEESFRPTMIKVDEKGQELKIPFQTLSAIPASDLFVVYNARYHQQASVDQGDIPESIKSTSQQFEEDGHTKTMKIDSYRILVQAGGTGISERDLITIIPVKISIQNTF